jgi:hypothetical protein
MTQKSHQRTILIEKIELTTNPAPSQIKKKKLASLAPFQKKKTIGLRCMLHLLIGSTGFYS